MVSAHTPETWEAVGCEVRTAVTAEDRRGWGVATTLHGTEASKRHEHARLIAAAPELLELVRDLLNAHEGAVNVSDDPFPDDLDRSREWLERVHAVRAKAEGGR